MKNNRINLFSLSPAVLGAVFAGSLLLSNASTTPVYGNYYTSDYDTRESTIENSEKLNQEITGEGITLLKNEDNALPLSAKAKISVFGKNSSSIILGGSGSGAGGGGTTISLNKALSSSGFQLNQQLTNFYADNTLSGSGRGSAPSNGQVSAGYNTGETPISSYTADLESSYAAYSDAAIVVISRIGGEGFDLPRSMKYNGTSYGSSGSDATLPVPGARGTGDDHYLQLDQNESDLIKYCGEKFNKVIVLLNTGSQFECGFLDDPNNYGYSANVKAALWIGYPGANGITSLAQILKGEINPSGRTVDTYSRDFTKDPTYKNFGNNLVEIDSSHKGNQYANLPGSGGNGGGGYANNYVTYKEGIYVGYRYYETRGFDEGDGSVTDGSVKGTTTTSWDNWYKANVVYPFGYGLSYTTFTQTIKSCSPSEGQNLGKDESVKVVVTVTNTGLQAGKDAVELYYNSPYTKGGIEKSYVVLGAFGKSSLLNPGQSEDITLTIKARDMASYDWNDANKNDFKGYELEKGTYNIMLMNDAHNLVSKVGVTVPSDIQYATDDATDGEIKNRFDDVSNYVTDDIKSEYFTRADWEGSFPTTSFRLTASDNVINNLKLWRGTNVEDTNAQPYYTATMPTTGASNGLKLKDLVGVDYNDTKWNSYLDQLTVDQMTQLATQGAYQSGINSSTLGISTTPNADGPAGFLYGAPSGTYSSWCCETVLASTWSKDLAYKKGKMMGNQALWGNGNASSKISGWYAPACDIHRSPFSGRNFEYYSEDGALSGYMAAEVVKGAQDKGLFAYVKHFGLNDQESNRCGLLTWANEQSMREIFFKPFELTVKVGHTYGIMSSLNKIGTVWAGGDYQLLTGLLRDEWGFQGCVVTDSFHGGWSNADQMIRAGGNLALGNASLSYNKDSATAVQALRNASHGLLFAHANSNAMNESDYPVAPSGIKSYDGRSLKTGVVGAQYSENIASAVINTTLYPDASDSDITYSLAAGNSLPKGLILTPDGKITGTPTEEVNNFSFTVNATYDTYVNDAQFIVSIVNSSGSIVYQADTTMANATIGQTYTGSVTGASIFKPDASEDEIAKFPPVTYALANGSVLPDGLTLNEDGSVTGTATKECLNYPFTVEASALGYKAKSLTFNISIYYSLEYTSSKLANGKLNVSYYDQVHTATSSQDVSYSLKSGTTLPKGLILTEGGNIVGTPLETVSDKKFTVIASSAYCLPVEADYSITIGLNYTSTELTSGKEGQEYSSSVDTAQGAGTINYALKEGSSLPAGLTLSANGQISGTPTKAGVYTFSVVASADGKAGDETTFTLYVANADKTPENPETPTTNKGCGGSIATVSSIAAAIGLLGAGLVFKKHKDSKKSN